MKSFTDLANMAKGFLDENQQLFVQQELERLFSSTWGGGRGGESRDLHRVGADKSSASTTTDTNTSFATPSTTKQTISEIWGSKTCGDSQWICYFFCVKLGGSKFVTWFMSILKFGLPRKSFEVFWIKTKTKLFWAISVSSERNIKSTDYSELVLSRQTCQRNHLLQETVWTLSNIQRPLCQISIIKS